MKQCDNCKYWISNKGEKKIGICRRYSPEMGFDGFGLLTVLYISRDRKGMWPETEYDDWCGEYDSETKAASE